MLDRTSAHRLEANRCGGELPSARNPEDAPARGRLRLGWQTEGLCWKGRESISRRGGAMANRQAAALQGGPGAGEPNVGIGNLRVVLLREEGAWYAQGLEIDCVAQGLTIDEAKANFEVGLRATIRENQTIHGTIRPVLVPAPREVWMDLLDAEARPRRFSSLSTHPIESDSAGRGFLPFGGIDYFESPSDASLG